MGKYLYLLFILYSLSTMECSKAVNVECSFYNISFPTVGSVYTCVVTKNLNITSPENAIIESVSGTHMSGKSNDDNMAFHAYDQKIEYFPKGLERFFKNLKVIYIPRGRFKQISQADLKPHPNLVHLEVYYNDVEILEDGLFDNHPNMQVVWFQLNKIFHVGKNVFKNMNNITYLGFGSNQCVNVDVHDNATQSLELIDALKVKCFDVYFANFSQTLSNLENESKNLTFETFPIWRENLENLENEFNSSRFSYLISIKERFKVLNAISIDDLTTQNPVTTSTTEVAVTTTSKQPDDCMSDNFQHLENNLSETFKSSLNQTEHNLKNSFAESCTDVNYQTLHLMKDEFTKINEKLFEHSSEVRSELIKNDEQHSLILNKIEELETELADVKEKLSQILDAVNREK